MHIDHPKRREKYYAIRGSEDGIANFVFRPNLGGMKIVGGFYWGSAVNMVYPLTDQAQNFISDLIIHLENSKLAYWAYNYGFLNAKRPVLEKDSNGFRVNTMLIFLQSNLHVVLRFKTILGLIKTLF